jgi:hypothetical protein
MLHPNQRELYLNAVRPPPGYQLDRAIATTYSLDLSTLLSLPLSFALLDRSDEEGELKRNPVALLHALRAYAGKLTIFCQAGGIAVPTQRHPLYSHLEESIIPVRKAGGAFHPKLWLLRFISPGEPVRYRFLCLSRNITGDPSWDTVLALNGVLADRTLAFRRNHPLANFLSALPGLAVEPANAKHLASIELLSDEVRRVRFEIPEPFKSYEFLPMGLPGFAAPYLPEDTRDLLIVSPFVSTSFLDDIVSEASTSLVSRAESLDAIEPSTLEKFSKLYVVDSATWDGARNDQASEDESQDFSDDALEETRGLHAKLYLADCKSISHLWTGSANATNAGFNHNVEFLTRLSGKKREIGIGAFLNGSSDTKGFLKFLSPYSIPKSQSVDNEAAQQNIKAAEELKAIITNLPLRIEISGEGNFYRMALRVTSPLDTLTASKATAVAWPITLPPTSALSVSPLRAGERVEFVNLSSQSLTAFMAILITAGHGKDRAQLRFVLKLPLFGAPADRFEALLQNVLSNPKNVLLYILLLVNEDEERSSHISNLLLDGENLQKSRAIGDMAVPLFEQLTRALAKQPELLDGVKSLVDDLRKTPGGAALLPSDFDAVWEPIWSARERLQK